jgi:hypothetical protein
MRKFYYDRNRCGEFDMWHVRHKFKDFVISTTSTGESACGMHAINADVLSCPPQKRGIRYVICPQQISNLCYIRHNGGEIVTGLVYKRGDLVRYITLAKKLP